VSKVSVLLHPTTPTRAVYRHKRTLRWKTWARVTLSSIMTVVLLIPFFWLITIALKSEPELAELPIHIFPQQLEWENFVKALTLIDYLHYTENTLILSGTYAVLTTLTCAMVGFAFARLRGRGKRFWFLLMLSTIMMPPIITLIPTYIIYTRLNLLGTYWPWVLSGLGSSPFLSFLFRQFFASIPQELEEAAIVDGCNYWLMFWRIFLPISRPALATSLLLSFAAVWGDYITPSLLLNSDNTTLAVAMSGSYVNEQGLALINISAAGVIMYIVPVLLLFFFVQRYFVRGIVTTGLKG